MRQFLILILHLSLLFLEVRHTNSLVITGPGSRPRNVKVLLLDFGQKSPVVILRRRQSTLERHEFSFKTLLVLVVTDTEVV